MTDCTNPGGTIKSFCGSPPTAPLTPAAVVQQMPECAPEPCQEEIPLNAPDPAAAVNYGKSPCSAPLADPMECCWSDEKISSIPPAIPCAPVNVGWAMWDGGMKWWGGEKDPSVLENAFDKPMRVFKQWNWHHILDLQQADSWHSNLLVRRNSIQEDISEMEFLTLAVRICQLGQILGVSVPPLVSDQFGMAVVQTGVDVNNIPTFGLGMTYGGQPIGKPLPLEAHWDATGQPVALTFSAAGLPSLTP